MMNWNEQIEDIMDSFDFSRVQKAMNAIGWKWAAKGMEPAYIPTEKQLRQKARELMKDVTSCAIKSKAEGGLKVVKHDDDHELTLEFIIEHYRTYNE